MDVKKCPATKFPEYAFIGRSNVGKSSLINLITGTKKLAKISVSPGKTQTINHFLINDSWYLVDLPGYGFAKISKDKRQEWLKLINRYILERENLTCLFILLDSRVEPQKNDMEFITWVGTNQIPFVIVFTKSDKLKHSQLSRNISLYKEKLLETWEELPPMLVTSAITRSGKEEILEFINNTNLSVNNVSSKKE